MEKTEINGKMTRRHGSVIEQQDSRGLWKPTTDKNVLERVKEIELSEMISRNPVLYGGI